MIDGNIKDIITNELGEYKLSLVTDFFMYYVNETEEDENACVIMTNKKGEIISDNYLAFLSCMEDLESILNSSIGFEYIDEIFLKSAKEYLEMNPF